MKSAGIAAEGDDEANYAYFEQREPEAAQGYVSEVMGDAGEIEDIYEETEDAALDAEHGEGGKFRPVFLSTNAITLSGRIQVVIRFYGDPEAIHTNYDFVHCTNYWTKKSGVVLNAPAMEALLTRELRYVGSKYPVCSLIRIRKFTARGWTINAGQVLKACMQVNALDLTNLKVLQDQLTGIDAAYFMQVIDMLSEKGGEKVDAAYLIEIIDRMF